MLGKGQSMKMAAFPCNWVYSEQRKEGTGRSYKSSGFVHHLFTEKQVSQTMQHTFYSYCFCFCVTLNAMEEGGILLQ